MFWAFSYYRVDFTLCVCGRDAIFVPEHVLFAASVLADCVPFLVWAVYIALLLFGSICSLCHQTGADTFVEGEIVCTVGLGLFGIWVRTA